MSSSASDSDGLSGGAVGWSGDAGSISALFESSESGTSLGGVSSGTGSPILISGSSEDEAPIAEAAEQVAASEESGDIIGIDVGDEGDEVNLLEISGYDWAPYEPRTVATRFRWGNDLGDLVERTRIFSEGVEDGHLRRADLAVLKILPDKIPPRPLIQCLRSPDLSRAVYAASPTGQVPPTAAPAGTSGAVSRPRLVVKRPGSGAAAAAAGDKGKKSKRDDPPIVPPFKKQKHRETSGSLADAFLGGGACLDEEVFLQLGPRMTEALKDVSEEDALRTAGELTLRLAALYTKFPRPERSRIEDLEKELAAAKTELKEVKASAADLKAQFDRLNGIKTEHAKCAGLLKAADDRAKAEQAKAGEAAEELRKLQRRFDDLTLEHMAASSSASDWQKKAKDLEAELEVADEQVFAQYELGFQRAVDLAVFHYNCSPDRFDVHMGVVDGKVERVFDRLDEVNDPPA
ncbi:hypothetical protein DEO72_LG1g595 [Vigna unguiculata]|uniref:Uncharacterized protein n=1 Tax=Vigna unguiculata TaxID=3917 RepID=A0A4D6KKL8_VIGUN|nr:hypothetical protein DEO72_LG1g595 [Vigna unguiculata]